MPKHHFKKCIKQVKLSLTIVKIVTSLEIRLHTRKLLCNKLGCKFKVRLLFFISAPCGHSYSTSQLPWNSYWRITTRQQIFLPHVPCKNWVPWDAEYFSHTACFAPVYKKVSNDVLPGGLLDQRLEFSNLTSFYQVTSKDGEKRESLNSKHLPHQRKLKKRVIISKETSCGVDGNP